MGFLGRVFGPRPALTNYNGALADKLLRTDCLLEILHARRSAVIWEHQVLDGSLIEKAAARMKRPASPSKKSVLCFRVMCTAFEGLHSQEHLDYHPSGVHLLLLKVDLSRGPRPSQVKLSLSRIVRNFRTLRRRLNPARRQDPTLFEMRANQASWGSLSLLRRNLISKKLHLRTT